MRGWWCLGLLVLLWCLGRAQALEVQRDPRLSQLVRVRVAATPLHQLVQLLKKQTGVELSVEPPLREYRAFARFENRPLHEVLELLAEAFGFEWRVDLPEKGVDAPPRYVLYQPALERQREMQHRALLNADILELTREALSLIPPELLERSYEEFCGAIGYTVRADKVFPRASGRFQPRVALPSPAKPRSLRTEAVLAVRAHLLQSGAETPKAWFVLRMLATLNSAEWATLRARGCLRLSPNRLPPTWREQWVRDYIRLHEYSEEDVAAYRPSSEEVHTTETITNINTVLVINNLEKLRAVWQGNYYVECFFDPRRNLLKAQLLIVDERFLSTSGWIELDNAVVLAAMASIGREPPYEPPSWLATVPDEPIRRIAERAWTQAWERQWEDWLSYHLVEGLESARAEGVGEFYPLGIISTRESDLAAKFYAMAQARWRGLLSELLYFYNIEPRNGVWVFQARARYLGRALDVSQHSLAKLTAAPFPTLDELAAVAQKLSQRQIVVLSALRSGYRYWSARPIDAWDDLLGGIARHRRGYYALQWYAALSAAQRAALKRGLPIAYNEMTPFQRALIEVALAADDFTCRLHALPKIRYAQLVYEEEELTPSFADERPSLRLTYRLEFCDEEDCHHIVEFVSTIPKK